jgi:hypothetical protein
MAKTPSLRNSAWHTKVLVAEGCERLAKHAAFLAEGDAYPPVDRLSEMVHSVDDVSRKPRLPERLVRGLVALLATPFLLLVTLGIALWVVALHKMRGGIFESARRRSRWWRSTCWWTRFESCRARRCTWRVRCS